MVSLQSFKTKENLSLFFSPVLDHSNSLNSAFVYIF